MTPATRRRDYTIKSFLEGKFDSYEAASASANDQARKSGFRLLVYNSPDRSGPNATTKYLRCGQSILQRSSDPTEPCKFSALIELANGQWDLKVISDAHNHEEELGVTESAYIFEALQKDINVQRRVLERELNERRKERGIAEPVTPSWITEQTAGLLRRSEVHREAAQARAATKLKRRELVEGRGFPLDEDDETGEDDEDVASDREHEASHADGLSDAEGLGTSEARETSPRDVGNGHQPVREPSSGCGTASSSRKPRSIVHVGGQEGRSTGKGNIRRRSQAARGSTKRLRKESSGGSASRKASSGKSKASSGKSSSQNKDWLDDESIDDDVHTTTSQSDDDDDFTSPSDEEDSAADTNDGTGKSYLSCRRLPSSRKVKKTLHDDFDYGDNGSEADDFYEHGQSGSEDRLASPSPLAPQPSAMSIANLLNS